MVQKRTFDYRSARSSENLNQAFKGMLPSGLWDGLRVSVDGAISPGFFVTDEGVKIEETEAVSVEVPAGHETLYRRDNIIMRYEYEKTVPAPIATFEVLQGTPDTNEYPDHLVFAPDTPEGAYSIATALMNPGETEWAEVSQKAYRTVLINCRCEDSAYYINNGSQSAYWIFLDLDSGYLYVFVQAPGELADNDQIFWSSAAFELTPSGQPAINDKLSKTGGTITGETIFQAKVNVDGGMEFDADDIASVVFDDWVTFTHWLQPMLANSAPGGWDNLGYTWKSIADGLGKILYIPIPGMVGAELVSVDVGLENIGLVATDIEAEFATSPQDDLITGNVEFGAETISVDGETNVITNLLLLDPVAPNDPLPFAFDTSRLLWLKLKTGGADIMYAGCKLNYRRKQLAI